MNDDTDHLRRGFYATLGVLLALCLVRIVEAVLSYLLGLLILLFVGVVILLHHVGVF